LASGSSAYVFPARRAAKRFPHVSPDTLNVTLRSLAHGLDHFAVHDFRRTMRSELSGLGVWADLLQTLERGEKYKVVSIPVRAAAWLCAPGG